MFCLFILSHLLSCSNNTAEGRAVEELEVEEIIKTLVLFVFCNLVIDYIFS